MPELTDVSPDPAPATVTVSVFPTPSPVPDPPAPPPADPPPAPPEGPQLDDALVLDLVEGINGLNVMLEGDSAGPTGPLMLDPVQFGVLGVGFALVIALLAALFVLTLRR